ncbi:MAG TPA: ComEC/Rec2 family competence protein, partial [Candidatus Eisenbacteria bacterium]|nr:ComEC/Rec2 family competence protein [Candidatus Eisenbacteria bacterium]
MACAVALWAGMLLGTPAGAVGCAMLLALALGFVLLGLRAPDRTGTVCLLLALLAIGAARAGGHRLRLEAIRARLPPLAHAQWADVRVDTPPTRASDEPIATVQVLACDAPLARGTRLRLRLPADAALEWGDRARCLIEADVPPRARNPGALDSRASADAEAVAGTGRALAALPRGGPWRERWSQWVFMRARRAIEAVLQRELGSDARTLVVPLVTGDRSLLPPERAAELRAAGLVHLLALSGLHVTFMAAVAGAVCASLGGGLRARGVARAACGLGYLGFAGPLPSLLRASVSEALGGAARAGGRALDPAHGLAVTALALLVLAPGLAHDLGFQFSCAATLGLVTLGARLRSHAPRALRWLASAGAAQAASAPVLLARMHVLTWLGAGANVVAVPVAALLLSAAWMGALLELAVPGSGRLAFSACELLSVALERFCAWAASVPHAVWPGGHEGGVVACAALGGVLLLIGLGARDTIVSRARPPSAARTGAVVIGGVLVALAWGMVLSVRPMRPPPGRWWLVALDVGQGDATALGFGDGWWLVDAGARTPHRDEGEAAVLPFMRWGGIPALDGLVLTHDDGDHTGGAPAVRRGLRVLRTLAAPPLAWAPGP